MYFKPGNAEMHQPVTLSDKVLLAFTAGLVLLIGIAPQIFLQVLQ
jgi:NADH:ubiquinone oxidoreductase subunit 2 (subunit N)